ncbi:MAG TPA: sigma-70 family RNA polymerase sigma factor [Bacteroidia bacterium]|nr:sigma-70 family RNA polymerase sigma factor [Bacteroidia bacterium]
MPVSSKYNHYTDNELINNFLETNNNEFVGALYERYGHLVLGLCIKYMKNKDEAKDLVIQIFSGLLTDLKKHKIQFFKSWLYVYSKNSCLMELRKRQRELKKELDLQDNVHLIMDFSSPDHLKEKEQQISTMESALEKLNKEQKICIELFYLKNKSYVEIMEITGYSNNDVKSYIQNGKRNLKIKMEELLNGEQEGS